MKKSLFCLLLVLFSGLVNARGQKPYEPALKDGFLENVVSFMADDVNAGRASGTEGKFRCEQFIAQSFRLYGLKPYKWNYTQSFRYRDSITLRNVAGVMTSSIPSDEYIIISAHYDHLGVLKGTTYNGADDNASGVAVLLGVAKMFSEMREAGYGPWKNLIFVAFDGKELSLSGSRHFVKHLNIPAERITAAINIDIIGTNLVPPGRDSSYIMAIGEETLAKKYQGVLKPICLQPECKLDLCLSFYGSRDFTKMVYENGDHYNFAKKKIPAVFFTSGFHKHTYKPTDDTDIIDFPLLKKRTYVIFNYINRLCR